MATPTAPKPTADLAYLCRAMKAPSLAAVVGRLGERADVVWAAAHEVEVNSIES